MEMCPYSYFQWCGYIRGPWVPLVTIDEFSVRFTNITSRTGVAWAHSLLSYFYLFLTQWIMAILLKGCKPDNFESHNLSKTYFYKYLWLSFEFCWMGIFPWIKLSWHSGSMWDKLGWLNWFWQFLFDQLSSLIRKNSITHMYGLAVYLKEVLPFALDLSLESSTDSYLCLELALLNSVSYLFSSTHHLLHLYARFFILFHLK